MAIVTIALPLSGIRGMLGGIVFSANRAGPFARGWSMPTNPTTPKQMYQRGLVAQAGALWRTLSTADQADWDTFSQTPPETDYNSLGEEYLLSGFGWFTRILLRRRRVGLADDLQAPVNTPTAPPDTFGLELHPTGGIPTDAIFSYTSGDFVTDYAILVLSQAPGLGTNVQTARYLICWEGLGVEATYTEFGTYFQSAFGATQVDQRFFGRLYRQSLSGIRSTPLELFSEVVA